MHEESAHTGQDRKSSIVMIGMLLVAVFFSMIARAVFSPLMPSVQDELGISLATAGSLFLLVNVSFAVSMLCSGFLASRIGHGLTVVASLAVVAVGLFVSAIATGIVLISMGMIFIGLGAGIYPASGIAMINRKIGPARRTAAFAIHETGPNFAMFMAPVIVLVTEPLIGWRGVLMFMGIICCIATVAFWRWGVADSGVGAAPNFSTIGTIMKLRSTYVGMIVLTAAVAGLHGIYAIVPAYLVAQSSHSVQEVNFLLMASRLVSVAVLLFAGVIVTYIGKRRMLIGSLAFTAVCTVMIGFFDGWILNACVIAQPALVAAMFPPLLSSIADIGDSRYQNITYSLIITIGISVGAGGVPALLGTLGDIGLGWLGFVLLCGFMLSAVWALIAVPTFGRD